jgi:hypothetical protein
LNRIFIALTFTTLLLIVTACGSQVTDPTPIPPIELTPSDEGDSSTSPYPAPTLYAGPYPQPQEGQPTRVETTPLPTVTRAPDTASVSAIILLNDEPVAHYTFYLADVVKNVDGEESVAALRRLSSPRTPTDENGKFTFLNVPPGKYGLILDVVQTSYLLHDPKTNEQILITLEADEDLDLGTINFDQLPIP